MLQSVGDTTVTIIGLRMYYTTAVTYDLTIDGLYTYYVETGVAPVLVCNCNLAAHENAGGHTIDRQVNKSDEYLINRNLPFVSTFTDLGGAEAETGSNIEANAQAIQDWLSSSKSYDRGAGSFGSGSTVRIILRRNPTMSGGYRVHTSYVQP